MFSPYVQPGARVLDVGCGAGFASLGLARLVGARGTVVAVDLQAEMLAMVRLRATKAGLADRISLHQCRPERLDLASAFDFVNAFYMVHEVPDQTAFFTEIGQHLAPDGKLFIAEPIFHVTARAFAAMLAVARTTGLKVVHEPRIRLSRTVVFAPADHQPGAGAQ